MTELTPTAGVVEYLTANWAFYALIAAAAIIVVLAIVIGVIVVVARRKARERGIRASIGGTVGVIDKFSDAEGADTLLRPMEKGRPPGSSPGLKDKDKKKDKDDATGYESEPGNDDNEDAEEVVNLDESLHEV